MPEFDEPIKDYELFLKDEHARNVSDYFEDLVKTSQVDEHANIETIAEMRNFEAQIASGSSTRKWWRFARVMSIITAVALVGVAIGYGGWNYLWLLPAVGALVFIFMKVNPVVKELNERVAKSQSLRDEKAQEAWGQMAPLNSLFTWEAATELFEKTFPIINFDTFFSAQRLNDLHTNYGLSTQFNDGKSVLFSQSGLLRNNPFVITRYLQHWIGSKSYQGTLVIFWTEQTRNAQGQIVTVQRSQTLVANVVKPFPEFAVRTSIIYGHEAAPKLSFSRMPSNLSGLEDGLLNNWRKDHAIKKVEKAARKDVKTGTGNLTVMSNREFEAIFNAVDRDNEIEFRLLFTPLAQQEMVKLLNDRSVGYGDDFAFTKSGPINFVEPRHLSQTQLEGNPSMFRSLELAQARKFFNEFHADFFRSVYFGLAPLLTVPLYREARSKAVGSATDVKHEISMWDHEAMANFIGQDKFKHPESVTANLLKTSLISKDASSSEVSVTAYGYKGIPRTDFVPVLGGDGRWHQVPVPWIEYIDVERQSSMVVGVVKPHAHEKDEETAKKLTTRWQGLVSTKGLSAEDAFARGALAAFLLRK